MGVKMAPTKAEIEALQKTWGTGPRQVYAYAAVNCRLPSREEFDNFSAETARWDASVDLRAVIPGHSSSDEGWMSNSFMTEKGYRPTNPLELASYYQYEVLHGRKFTPGHGYPPPSCSSTAAPVDTVVPEAGNALTRIGDWVKDNPAMAAGAAVLAFVLLGSGSRRKLF